MGNLHYDILPCVASVKYKTWRSLDLGARAEHSSLEIHRTRTELGDLTHTVQPTNTECTFWRKKSVHLTGASVVFEL